MTVPLAAAPSPVITTSTPPPVTGSGWFDQLLVKAGVDPSTANSVVQFVWRPLVILFVIAVAVLVASIGSHAIRRGLGRPAARAAERAGTSRAGTRVTTVAGLLADLFKFFVAMVALFVVLGMLGVNLTPLLASATVIGATLGFGAQALVRDYLSGFLLTIEDQFGVGDTVTVGEVSGVVEDLSLRVTRLRGVDGTIWHVPNGDIRKVANRSRGWAKAVVDLPLDPKGPTDLPEVERALAQVATEVARSPRFTDSCTEPPEVLGLVASEGLSCTLRVALRTTPTLRDPLERALREALVERLVALGRWPTA